MCWDGNGGLARACGIDTYTPAVFCWSGQKLGAGRRLRIVVVGVGIVWRTTVGGCWVCIHAKMRPCYVMASLRYGLANVRLAVHVPGLMVGGTRSLVGGCHPAQCGRIGLGAAAGREWARWLGKVGVGTRTNERVHARTHARNCRELFVHEQKQSRELFRRAADV